MRFADDAGDGGTAAYVGQTWLRTISEQTASQEEHVQKLSGETVAYPTDERIRQKAKLKAGHIPTARKQVVEDHHDDCGTDLSGLAPYLLTSVMLVGDDSPVDYDDDDLTSSLTAGLSTWWLRGSSAPPGLSQQGERTL